MDAPDRHDTMVEATALAQTNEYESYHQGVVICSYLIVAVVACIAARDVAVQRAAHTGGVSPDLVGAAAGKDGVSRYERAHVTSVFADRAHSWRTGPIERACGPPPGA